MKSLPKKLPQTWTAKDGTVYSRRSRSGIMERLGWNYGFTDAHAIEYAEYLVELVEFEKRQENIARAHQLDWA